MRSSTPKFFLALGAPLMLAACATIGPPQPPSLELPKPPTDLRATRKGDRVNLTWTAPSLTTDRQRMRSVGPTRVCRSLETVLMQCGTPVGEAAAQSNPNPSKSSSQKIVGSYTDTLPKQLQSDGPSGFIAYAVEVVNAEGRGAGLSNQVRVSSARTLAPPANFGAQVTSQGVVLTWTSTLTPATSGQLAHYVYRAYRRVDGSPERILVGE